jgi:hypothetical protein
MELNLFFRLSFIALWALLAVVRVYYGRKTGTHSTTADVMEKLKTADARAPISKFLMNSIYMIPLSEKDEYTYIQH